MWQALFDERTLLAPRFIDAKKKKNGINELFDTTNNRKTAVQPSKSKQATTVNEILEKSRLMFGFSAMAFVRIEFDVRIFGSCVFVYTKIVH